MPVLTVHAGRSAPGQRAATSHTAAAAAPLITRQALFEQAGVIATDNLGELLDAAVLLATQPVPAGSRVAVVSNVGGGGRAGRGRLRGAGLTVATLSRGSPDRLAAILPRARARRPGGHHRRGPRRTFRHRLARWPATRRGRVLALVVRTAAGRPGPGADRGPAARPVAAVVLDQAGRGPAAARP